VQSLDPSSFVTLATLTILEIVLGVDNIVFIAILAGKLPKAQQKAAYRFGLIGALVTRLLLLLTLSWVMRLTRPLFYILDHAVSGRDLILVGGGLFLIIKSGYEIYDRVGEDDSHAKISPKNLMSTIVQIAVLDIVFSLDSIITAVGMSNQVPVMATAIVIAVGIMLVFAHPIGNFINHNPSVKILALAFLLLVGALLIAEGFKWHIDKGYLYVAMGFSLTVELLNIRQRRRQARIARTHAPHGRPLRTEAPPAPQLERDDPADDADVAS
jgi:predicted tellurium resistance membrane protein TerC